MQAPLPVLESVRVASPCSAPWEQMEGDDRARFCRECGKHVYNLSAMSRAEAEALIREKEGRLCVRFYRRRDGTLLTDDCPVGLRRVRRALLLHCAGIASLFALTPGMARAAQATAVRNRLGEREPVRSILGWLFPSLAPRRENPFVIQGELAMPITCPPPPPRRGS